MDPEIRVSAGTPEMDELGSEVIDIKTVNAPAESFGFYVNQKTDDSVYHRS